MTSAAEGVVVVTGAASGMGLACAQRLARSGSTMVLADRDPAVEHVAHELGAEVDASEVDSLVCDVGQVGCAPPRGA
jgi:NAD(P)-dependent dehydrogenase (short-subunit alcohol dehydrogenase family)